MNSVRSNNISLKYQRFKISGWRDIKIRKFELVAKTQFLCKYLLFKECLRQLLFLQICFCHDYETFPYFKAAKLEEFWK